ncbi:methionyl-tRNA formyltransferase, partial [Candidatus Woesebacteria bacterium]|nr:methionyl-tRNA formyltransferase [Candidatus Woesebacteria bacterium]
MESIVIATIKSWNLSAAKEFAQQHQKNFKVHVVSEKDALTEDLLSKIRPTYIFFPHWSWLIPESIFKKYTCV